MKRSFILILVSLLAVTSAFAYVVEIGAETEAIINYYPHGRSGELSSITPELNALNVSLTPTISLNVAEGYPSYELYFGNEPNPQTAIISFSDVANPISYTFTEPLEYSTDYYLTVILYDDNEDETTLNFTFKTRPSFAGTGTEADPYQIANINDLLTISEHETLWDKHYVQTADIDASSTSTLNEGAGFSPIGYHLNNNDYCYFTGSYNGDGYTISNLKINRPSTDYIGLFGYTSGANISNVSLVDNEINGNKYTGGLVGSSYSSLISNSYATGAVSVTGTYSSYVGGLVGRAESSSTIINSYATGAVSSSGNYGNFVGGLVGLVHFSSPITNSYATGAVNGARSVGGLVGSASSSSSISNSYATGNVSGGDYVGGLLGYANTNCTISNSYTTGAVSGSSYYVGGLVGVAHSSSTISNSYATGTVSSSSYCVGGLVGVTQVLSTISNSYATGAVSGTSDVGGLVGLFRDSSTISHSYATGAVSGTERVGGLVGCESGGSVANSFWDIETSGQTISDGGTGKTTQEMKNIQTFLDAGWDFVGETTNGTEDIWSISPETNSGYPFIIETGFSSLQILSFFPNETEIEAVLGSTLEFSVLAIGINSDLTYKWYVNQEEQECSIEQFSYEFTESLMYEVKVVVSEEENTIEQTWSITIPVNNDNSAATPLTTGIVSNYPNPFNPDTTIQYSLQQTGLVDITIYNLKGKVTKRLYSGYKDAGQHTISWDGLNDNKQGVASGIYYVRMKCAEKSFTRKITLMK